MRERAQREDALRSRLSTGTEIQVSSGRDRSLVAVPKLSSSHGAATSCAMCILCPYSLLSNSNALPISPCPDDPGRLQGREGHQLWTELQCSEVGIPHPYMSGGFLRLSFIFLHIGVKLQTSGIEGHQDARQRMTARNSSPNRSIGRKSP